MCASWFPQEATGASLPEVDAAARGEIMTEVDVSPWERTGQDAEEAESPPVVSAPGPAESRWYWRLRTVFLMAVAVGLLLAYAFGSPFRGAF
jgi:hypothetical protein